MGETHKCHETILKYFGISKIVACKVNNVWMFNCLSCPYNVNGHENWE